MIHIVLLQDLDTDDAFLYSTVSKPQTSQHLITNLGVSHFTLWTKSTYMLQLKA